MKNMSHDKARDLSSSFISEALLWVWGFLLFYYIVNILTEPTDCGTGQHLAEFHSLSGHPTELAVQSFLMLLGHKHLVYK